MAGCGGGGAPPPQLVDGTAPPRLPGALTSLNGAVMTRTRVVAASEIEPGRLHACDVRRDARPKPSTVVVERVGVGGSLTFKAGSSLNACDAIAHPFADPDRPVGSPWCGGSVGRLEDGRLNDPRLDLCTAESGDITAFVWVEPAADTRWVVVRDVNRREVYEVAGGLPVRVATTSRVDASSSSATFEIEEYEREGSELRDYEVDAAVSG